MPISISFHITIEIITGSVLILTFFVLRGARQWGRYLAVYSQGMLGYTVVNSAGYL